MPVISKISPSATYQQYYVAPHPDDIAFSCFGSLCHPQSIPERTLIVTVFDNSRFAFVRDLTQQTITELRKHEDAEFASYSGCDLLSLDFPDSSIRYQKPGVEYELSSGQDQMFEQVISRLQHVLESAFKENASIYIPLANSKHLDHMIVRDAVQHLQQNYCGGLPNQSRVFYYEDLPYASKMTNSELRHFAQDSISPAAQYLKVSLDNKWSQKRKAVSLYRTQLEESTLSNIHRHAQRVGGGVGRAERLWYAPAGSHSRKPAVDTVCWISWEACRLLGGCGVVLAAIVESPEYQAVVRRTVLMGPMYMPRDCIEYDPNETVEDIAHRLESRIVYRTHCDPHFCSLPCDIISKLRAIEAKHAIELVYMRDNRLDDHIVERLLFNFAGNISSKRVHSPSLTGFLDLLADKLDLQLPMEAIHQRTSLASTQLLLSSIQGRHGLDNAEFNFKDKSRIESDPANWNHVDDDYIYGLILAQPAAEAIRALVERGETCLLVAQEYLSLPAAYASLLSPHNQSIKTLYYVGEVRTICSLVEGCIEPRPVEAAMAGGNCAWDGPIRTLIECAVTNHEAFGFPERQGFVDFEPLRPLRTIGCHKILESGWILDKVVPICPTLLDELVFINNDFAANMKGTPSCFYHGVRPIQSSVLQRIDCKRRLLAYAKRSWAIAAEPNRDREWIILLRIARPVTAKAMHRDLAVVERLGVHAPDKKILFILITFWKGNTNKYIQSLRTEAARINGSSSNVHVRMVNGFLWPSSEEVGEPETHLTRDDLHRAVDVNLCLSSYDSFNLAALEGVSCGNLCVISSSCGAAMRVMELPGFDSNFLIVDYVKPIRDRVIAAKEGINRNELALSLFKISIPEKDKIEAEAAAETARRICDSLPESEEHMKEMIDRGMHFARQMSWDMEIKRGFIPIVEEMFGSTAQKPDRPSRW
ncbi:hypothetical protein MMC21_006536 [Puttea exsequens]|nr:hypothetical protein [Puttea exsequens]